MTEDKRVSSDNGLRQWLTNRQHTLLNVVGINLVTLAGAIVLAFPFYFMVIGSTHPESAIFQFPPQLVPGAQAVQNYVSMLEGTNFLGAFINSLLYAGGSTIGVLFVATCAGYAFAKFQFPGRKPLFYIAIATMAIPFQLIAIPLFKLLVDINLVNTLPGLILPALTHPIGVFFMKQNIEQTILDDMLNSARMDGASELRVFYHIVLPSLKPGIAALAVLMFMLRMNELFWPLIVMRSPENHVVTQFLTNLHGGVTYPTPWEVMLPAAVIATLPVFLVFVFLQKYFVSGLLAGSVKQ